MSVVHVGTAWVITVQDTFVPYIIVALAVFIGCVLLFRPFKRRLP